MDYYYAKFKSTNGILTREMTRIYFNPVTPSEKDENCIGVVIAKNPGAAKPTELDIWTKLNLSNDKMLQFIYDAFNKAFTISNYELPNNAYIRILNLFPVCNVDVDTAYKDWQKIDTTITNENADSNLRASRFIYIGWGNEPYLDKFRTNWIEILNRYSTKCFYISYKTDDRYNTFYKKGVPQLKMNVKHPSFMGKQLLIDSIRKNL